MTYERPPGEPTLDRRIERLERDFAKLEKDLALMTAEQAHLRELTTSRFAAVEATLARIEGAQEAARALLSAASSDPGASPLGRALSSDIAAAQNMAEEAKRLAQAVDRRVLLATGAVAVIAWVAGIAGPIAARVIMGMPI